MVNTIATCISYVVVGIVNYARSKNQSTASIVDQVIEQVHNLLYYRIKVFLF
jgi:hypothetical protein